MKLVKFVPDNTNIGFVAIRHWAFALTALLTILAVGATAYRGLNLGVDFVGGLMIEESFPTPPHLDKVRSTIDRLGVGEGSLQQFGDPRTVSIRLPPPKSTDQGATNAVVAKVQQAIEKDFPDRKSTRLNSSH